MVALSAFDHEYKKGEKNVVVVGDSRVGEGFSITVANPVGQKEGVNFIGLGMPGTTPRVWYYFLRRIARHTKPLAALVLMTDSLDDRSVVENLSNRDLDISYMMPLLRTMDILQFVESFHDTDARIRALRAAALPALAMQSDFHAFLTSPIARIEKARQFRRNYAGWMATYSGRPVRVPDVPRSVLFAPWFDPNAVSPNIAQSLGAYLRNLREPSHPVEETKEYRRLWYGRIAAFYQNRRVPVYVYQMPRGPFHKELVGDLPAEGSLLDLAHSGKIALLPSAPFVELEQPQFFFDFVHLNGAGRKIFSENLAKIVTPLVP
jgi:hypothetical protein